MSTAELAVDLLEANDQVRKAEAELAERRTRLYEVAAAYYEAKGQRLKPIAELLGMKSTGSAQYLIDRAREQGVPVGRNRRRKGTKK